MKEFKATYNPTRQTNGEVSDVSQTKTVMILDIVKHKDGDAMVIFVNSDNTLDCDSFPYFYNCQVWDNY